MKLEAEKKTTTKTKDQTTDWDALDALFAPRADQPLSTIDAPQQDPERAASDNTDMRSRSSQVNTQRTAGQVAPTQRMRDLMGRMRDIEGDDEPVPDEPPENLPSTRVNTANLPTVASQALQVAGVSNPDFHKVANLPGNMGRAIRIMGKQLFRSMTRTPTDDIWMIGNLHGQGPNSSTEVNAVAKYVREAGEEITSGNIDFDTSIPGYQADIRQYSAGGIRWLLVVDEFGKYIYSWPESDSVHARPSPQGIGHKQARLPSR